MRKIKNNQPIKLFYRIDEYDKDNNLIRKGKRIKSKSFVRAFAELLNVHIAHRSLPIRDITNTVRTISMNPHNFISTAAAGETTAGIVVGSGTTPVTTSDFNLAAIIPHGAGAGQLFYRDSSCSLPTTTATNTHFTLERNVRNDTLANITINEIGLCSRIMEGPIFRHALTARDIITPRILVPTRSLSIFYEFEIPL